MIGQSSIIRSRISTYASIRIKGPTRTHRRCAALIGQITLGPLLWLVYVQNLVSPSPLGAGRFFQRLSADGASRRFGSGWGRRGQRLTLLAVWPGRWAETEGCHVRRKGEGSLDLWAKCSCQFNCCRPLSDGVMCNICM